MNSKNSVNSSYTKSYKRWTAFSWFLFGLILFAGLGYATTVNENSLISNNITLSSDNSITTINLQSGFMSPTGTPNRTRISFYAGSNTNAPRPLSIEAHAKNVSIDHANHVTLYSLVTNKTASRALEWYWGGPENGQTNLSADGSFRLVDLSYLHFENDWMGYYRNESALSPGLKFDGNAGTILLDADDSSTSSTSLTIENLGSSVSETLTVFLQGTRSFFRYNAGTNNFEFGGGLSKGATIFADNKGALNVATNGNVTFLNHTGVFKVQNLTGTGNVIACISATGQFYRGNATGCP